MRAGPSQLGVSPPSAPSAPVAVFWDIETCGVPQGVAADRVVTHISDALRARGHEGAISISAYGDVQQLPYDLREGLNATGITLHNVPCGHRDASDKVILVDILFWALEHPPPAHLFLISGDRDFASVFHRLKLKHYNVLLAAPAHAHLKPTLLNAASDVWEWIALASGDAHGPVANWRTQPGGSRDWQGQQSGPEQQQHPPHDNWGTPSSRPNCDARQRHPPLPEAPWHPDDRIEPHYEGPWGGGNSSQAPRSPPEPTGGNFRGATRRPAPYSVKRKLTEVLSAGEHQGMLLGELKQTLAMTGFVINFQHLGYSTLVDLLQSMPDVIRVESNVTTRDGFSTHRISLAASTRPGQTATQASPAVRAPAPAPPALRPPPPQAPPTPEEEARFKMLLEVLREVQGSGPAPKLRLVLWKLSQAHRHLFRSLGGGPEETPLKLVDAAVKAGLVATSADHWPETTLSLTSAGTRMTSAGTRMTSAGTGDRSEGKPGSGAAGLLGSPPQQLTVPLPAALLKGATASLKEDMLAPVEPNIRLRVVQLLRPDSASVENTGGESFVIEDDHWRRALAAAIDAGELQVVSQHGGGHRLLLPKDMALWPSVDPQSDPNTYSDAIWAALYAFLSTHSGQECITASRTRYAAARTIQKQASPGVLADLPLGQLIHLLQLAVQRRWLKPDPPPWKPCKVTLPPQPQAFAPPAPSPLLANPPMRGGSGVVNSSNWYPRFREWLSGHVKPPLGLAMAQVKVHFRDATGYFISDDDLRKLGFSKLVHFLESLTDLVRFEKGEGQAQHRLLPLSKPPAQQQQKPAARVVVATPPNKAEQVRADLRQLLVEVMSTAPAGGFDGGSLTNLFHRKYKYPLDYSATGHARLVDLIRIFSDICTPGRAPGGHMLLMPAKQAPAAQSARPSSSGPEGNGASSSGPVRARVASPAKKRPQSADSSTPQGVGSDLRGHVKQEWRPAASTGKAEGASAAEGPADQGAVNETVASPEEEERLIEERGVGSGYEDISSGVVELPAPSASGVVEGADGHAAGTNWGDGDFEEAEETMQMGGTRTPTVGEGKKDVEQGSLDHGQSQPPTALAGEASDLRGGSSVDPLRQQAAAHDWSVDRESRAQASVKSPTREYKWSPLEATG